MTKALENAFRAASRLSETAQDALERLADEALSEEAAGRTEPLDPDGV